MKKNKKSEIITHYQKLYKKYGLNPASLGWLKGKQEIRFKILTEIGNLENSSILDIGCGFGDLVAYLESEKIKAEYMGIDINPEFVKIAKGLHPTSNFGCRDIEINPLRTKFDWIFAVGTTNQSGSYGYIKNLLTGMLKISKRGVAMDFLSSYVDYKVPKNFHASPEKILKIAKALSKRVVIRHDYLPFEFCVYIYKNDTIRKDLSYKK